MLLWLWHSSGRLAWPCCMDLLGNRQLWAGLASPAAEQGSLLRLEGREGWASRGLQARECSASPYLNGATWFVTCVCFCVPRGCPQGVRQPGDGPMLPCGGDAPAAV